MIFKDRWRLFTGCSSPPQGRRGAPKCRPAGGWRLPRMACLTALVLCVASLASADTMPLVVSEGTDLNVAVVPGGPLIVHIAGRLWRLPPEGGDAVAITGPDELVRRPAISPDGQTLAFEAEHNGKVQVFLAAIDGQGRRQVTSGPANYLTPAWSPDGKRLALASDRGGDFSIWELDTDSLALRQLTFEPDTELDPAWAPAGDSMVYVREQRTGSSLVLQQPAGSSQVLAANPGRLRAPAWRPDGSVITYVADLPEGPRLNMVILSQPPVIKPVAPGEAASAAPLSWVGRNEVVYAADGRIRRRAFGAARAVDVPFLAEIQIRMPAAPLTRRLPERAVTGPVRSLGGIAPLPGATVIASALGDLWEIDAAGQPVRPVSESSEVERDPAASRDGRLVAFSSDRDGSTQIWVVELPAGNARQVSREPGEARFPAWKPDKPVLAYLAGDAAGPPGQTLQLVDLETGEVISIATGLAATGAPPAWSHDGSSLGILHNAPGNPQLIQFSVDPPHERRRMTLPAETVGADGAQLQFSPDGRRLLVASAHGIFLLPVAEDGLVGVDWQQLTDRPVHAARWMPDGTGIWFADDGGLGRVGRDEPLTRAALNLRWHAPGTAGRSTIHASRVFDGLTESYLFNQDIVVEDGRIVAVEPWAAEPTGYVIDARGKTVVPGLIDAAVDLSGAAGTHAGRALLAYGVTTIQLVNAADPGLRDDTERWLAQRSGPRVLQLLDGCGPQPETQTVDPVIASGAAQICGRDADAASAAETMRERGLAAWSADWRSVLAGPIHGVDPPHPWENDGRRGLPGSDGFYYQDAIDAIIHSGAAFLPRVGGAMLPLLTENFPDLLDGDQTRLLQGSVQRRMQLQGASHLPSGQLLRRRSALQARLRLASRVHAGGGRVAAASGAAAGAFGLALHADMQALSAAGMSSAASIRAATADAAQALGLQEEIGTIAAGRLADLLIIDGDPLADLRALRRIEAVMLEGHWQPLATILAAPAPALEKFTPTKSEP